MMLGLFIFFGCGGELLYTHQPPNPTAKFVQVAGNITYLENNTRQWPLQGLLAGLHQKDVSSSNENPSDMMFQLSFGLLTWCLFWMVNGSKALKRGLQIGPTHIKKHITFWATDKWRRIVEIVGFFKNGFRCAKTSFVFNCTKQTCHFRFTIIHRKQSCVIWVFPKIGVPQNGWFIMEHPIKMGDLGVPSFSETPIYMSTYISQIMYVFLCLKLSLGCAYPKKLSRLPTSPISPQQTEPTVWSEQRGKWPDTLSRALPFIASFFRGKKNVHFPCCKSQRLSLTKPCGSKHSIVKQGFIRTWGDQGRWRKVFGMEVVTYLDVRTSALMKYKHWFMIRVWI